MMLPADLQDVSIHHLDGHSRPQNAGYLAPVDMSVSADSHSKPEGLPSFIDLDRQESGSSDQQQPQQYDLVRTMPLAPYSCIKNSPASTPCCSPGPVDSGWYAEADLQAVPYPPRHEYYHQPEQLRYSYSAQQVEASQPPADGEPPAGYYGSWSPRAVGHHHHQQLYHDYRYEPISPVPAHRLHYLPHPTAPHVPVLDSFATLQLPPGYSTAVDYMSPPPPPDLHSSSLYLPSSSTAAPTAEFYHPQQLQQHPDSRSELPACSSSAVSRRRPRRRKGAGQPKIGKLWQFLLALLHDKDHNPSVIRWEDFSRGQFKFVQSDTVARLWGSRKGFQTNMTYEKLSRAMRYYYKPGILKPVVGRRLVYAFGPKTIWSKPPDMSVG